MNKIKAVIFDMDGLIVDTELVHSKSVEAFLKEQGVEPQYHPNGLIHVIGHAGKQTEIDLLKKYQLQIDVDTYISIRRGKFEELLKEKLTPLPGFMELLSSLHEAGYKIALASNRFEEHIHMILNNLGVTKYFDVIVGPNDERRHKPHPDIYIHTAKELGVKPDECVVLEDSNIGVLAGKAAGMKAIAVPNEYTKELDFSKADLLVNSLAEIKIETIENV